MHVNFKAGPGHAKNTSTQRHQTHSSSSATEYYAALLKGLVNPRPSNSGIGIITNGSNCLPETNIRVKSTLTAGGEANVLKL